MRLLMYPSSVLAAFFFFLFFLKKIIFAFCLGSLFEHVHTPVGAQVAYRRSLCHPYSWPYAYASVIVCESDTQTHPITGAVFGGDEL